MFWTVNKLKKRITKLDEIRYKDKFFISYFHILKDNSKMVNPPIPPKDAFNDKLNAGDVWGGRDEYYWIRNDIKIPPEWKNDQVVAYFDFGKTGPGTNSGFESLFYVNKAPYQGVDTNHMEVFLDQSLTGTDVDLTLRLWTGLEGGGTKKHLKHEFKQAFIARLDKQVDEFYYLTKTGVEFLDYCSEDNPDYQILLAIYDRAFNMIDWSSYDIESTYESIYKSLAFLKEALKKEKVASKVNIHAIGHTHIDVAWLWQLKHTREKCARSFSTVLNLMKHHDDYIFLQTQPQLYKYIKKDYPDIYKKIKERVNSGEWEASGGMWLEADCNLINGESLVRQILKGKQFYKDEFNADCTYLWLPDVFGYSYALPQILLKSGIDKFVTTKISWNQFNRIPHDTFYWRGMDGSEILTHFITTPNMGQAEFDAGDLIHYTYNGYIHPKTVTGIWKVYADKEINNDLLLSYGYGDGGGGVNRDMLETINAVKQIPGMPNITTTRVDDYLDKLQENVETTSRYVHTWDDELYLEFHRGTYTTHADVKKANRTLEFMQRNTEILSSHNLVENNNYHQEQLDESLEIMLRNQFHDIIPGTSITEVYEDAELEYQEAFNYLSNVNEEVLNSLIDSKENYTIYNHCHYELDTIVKIDEPINNELYLGEDKLVKQIYDNNTYVAVKKLKPLSYNNIVCSNEESNKSDSIYDISSNQIETDFYIIKWNEYGQLTSVLDKEHNIEVLKGLGNVLTIVDDQPLTPDSWEIESYYYVDTYNQIETISDLQSVILKSHGPLFSVVEFAWNYKHTEIKQEMIIYNVNKRIDFKTTVDWKERQKMLKVNFDVNIRNTKATYDTQFGNIERPTHWNTSWDLAKFEVCGHQWADLSERNYGVSLLNDCKYGYNIKDNRMSLSLVRGSIFPDPIADLGIHEFTYSIYPHTGDWYEAETVKVAYDLNNPLGVVKGTAKEKSLFNIDGDSVFVSTVKKAEVSNEVIIRLYDYSGGKSLVNISSDYEIINIDEVDLLENITQGNISLEGINFNPYEIKTFKVLFK